MKIHPVGAELLRAVGHSDMTTLIVTFHNFANTPKNENTLGNTSAHYRFQGGL